MNNDYKTFKIFVDFDGTITQKDVGENMFLTFGDPEKANEIIQLWLDRKITSTQTWDMLCKTVDNFNFDEFDRFLDGMKIDESFHSFTNYCKKNNYTLKILSDGLDYYIKNILKRENLLDIEHFTNKVTFDKNNNLICEFPYTDEECKLCANCKRNHIISNSSDDDYTVYIGDGWSDTCPAQYCDFIFAKKSLLKFCEQNRISYFPFKNFNDISIRLDELSKKKKLKKRHQAFLKRRETYMQG